MKVTAIYGNPKKDGFVHDCIDCSVEYIKKQGIDIEKIKLVEMNIQECTGCFACLKTGICVIDDDMNNICEKLRNSDGFVIGASVRNSFFPALYKKFYERITYPIVFTRDLKDKPVLAIGAVGLASGKKALGRLISFTEIEAKRSGYLFFRTGIPTKIAINDVSEKIISYSKKILEDIKTPKKQPLLTRMNYKFNNYIIKKFMLEKDKNGTYANVIKVWRERGWM